MLGSVVSEGVGERRYIILCMVSSNNNRVGARVHHYPIKISDLLPGGRRSGTEVAHAVEQDLNFKFGELPVWVLGRS